MLLINKISLRNIILKSFAIAIALYSINLHEVLASTEDDNIKKCIAAIANCDKSKKHCNILKNCNEAAEQGHPLCQQILGLSYKSGLDNEVNLNKAFYWIEKSAKQGDGSAQLFLGLMYSMGEGVKQDGVEALNWISKAHQKNIEHAEQGMYEVYNNELRIRKTAEAKVQFINIATVIPFPKAQYDSSLMSYNVYNTVKDESLRNKALIDAYRWVRIANSDSEVIKGLWNKPEEWKLKAEEIKSKMSASQIEEANKLVERFFGIQKEVYENFNMQKG